MKKFICILLMIAMVGLGYAQRPSSSGSRSSSTTTSRSVSSSPSRSSSSATSRTTTVTTTRTTTPAPGRSTTTTRTITTSNIPPRDIRPNSAPRTAPTHSAPADHPRHIPHGMHPHPPMYHPHNHHHIHMHYCCIDHWYLHDCCWVGYWGYVHCHPHHEVVIYARNTYSGVEVINLATDEFYIYTLMRDHRENQTYFQISNDMDKVILKVPVHHRYQTLEIDSDGVWIFKNNGKDPIYFMRAGDQFFMYES